MIIKIKTKLKYKKLYNKNISLFLLIFKLDLIIKIL